MLSFGVLSILAILNVVESSLALPTANTHKTVAVPPDTIDKYTVEYFLSTAARKPPSASCIVYTSQLTKKAQAYASAHERYTIWDVWPCNFYDRSQSDTNPLRNILGPTSDGTNSPDTQKYFENMSEAYVALCDDYVLLMTDTLPNINELGIWGRIEKPRLQKIANPGGQVNVIDACDENATHCLNPPYWQRSVSPKPVNRISDISDRLKIQKRGGSTSNDPAPNACYNPKLLGQIFSDVDELW